MPGAVVTKSGKNSQAFHVYALLPTASFPLPQGVFSFRCLPTPATSSGTSVPSTLARGPMPARTAAKPLPPRLVSNNTSTFTVLSNLSYVSCHGHHRALAFAIIARILRGPPSTSCPSVSSRCNFIGQSTRWNSAAIFFFFFFMLPVFSVNIHGSFWLSWQVKSWASQQS